MEFSVFNLQCPVSSQFCFNDMQIWQLITASCQKEISMVRVYGNFPNEFLEHILFFSLLASKSIIFISSFGNGVSTCEPLITSFIMFLTNVELDCFKSFQLMLYCFFMLVTLSFKLFAEITGA